MKPDNEAFKSHVTSTAFHLTLSAPMIEVLCKLDQGRFCLCSFMTFYALRDRGMVTSDPYNNTAPPFPENLRLTEPGKAVIPLLKMAGLYQEFPQPTPPPETVPRPMVTLKEGVTGRLTNRKRGQ